MRFEQEETTGNEASHWLNDTESDARGRAPEEAVARSGDERSRGILMNAQRFIYGHRASPHRSEDVPRLVEAIPTRLPCRILLVDDSPVFLAAIEELVASIPETLVVGRATSGAEAIELAAKIQPDLVLMDFAMPWMDGLQTARCLRARIPAPRVLLMSVYNEPAYKAEAESAGADALLTKSELGVTLAPFLSRSFSKGNTLQ